MFKVKRILTIRLLQSVIKVFGLSLKPLCRGAEADVARHQHLDLYCKITLQAKSRYLFADTSAKINVGFYQRLSVGHTHSPNCRCLAFPKANCMDIAQCDILSQNFQHIIPKYYDFETFIRPHIFSVLRYNFPIFNLREAQVL